MKFKSSKSRGASAGRTWRGSTGVCHASRRLEARRGRDLVLILRCPGRGSVKARCSLPTLATTNQTHVWEASRGFETMFKTTQRLRKSTGSPMCRGSHLARDHRVLFRKSVATWTLLGSLSLTDCYVPNSSDVGDSGNSTGNKHQGDVGTEYSEVLAATTRFFGANRCGGRGQLDIDRKFLRIDLS